MQTWLSAINILNALKIVKANQSRFTVHGMGCRAREQLKLQAVMKSREEDEELGLGAYKGPPTRLLETDDEDYSDVKPWAPASSGKNPLLLSAFRVPDE